MNVLSNRGLRLAAVVACGICAVKVIQAFNPQPDPPGFGMVGITPDSQYARLNVSNVAIPGLPGTLGGGTCDVMLSFGDGQGHTFKSMIATLGVGKSVSLDLLAADVTPVNANLAPSPRVELLPAVQRGGACSLASSVEVVALATGQTSTYASHAALTFNHNETVAQDTESR